MGGVCQRRAERIAAPLIDFISSCDEFLKVNGDQTILTTSTVKLRLDVVFYVGGRLERPYRSIQSERVHLLLNGLELVSEYAVHRLIAGAGLFDMWIGFERIAFAHLLAGRCKRLPGASKSVGRKIQTSSKNRKPADRPTSR
jgi:hypothetical protein